MSALRLIAAVVGALCAFVHWLAGVHVTVTSGGPQVSALVLLVAAVVAAAVGAVAVLVTVALAMNRTAVAP